MSAAHAPHAGPLDGVRVLDLTTVFMGPSAGHRFQAIEGADVQGREGDCQHQQEEEQEG